MNPKKNPPEGAPEGTAWFGGPVDEASVTLRLFGDDLDPTEITRLLGVEPSEAARTGESVTRANGTYTARQGFWRLRSGRRETDIADQLLTLLARLTDDLSVWRALTSRYRADLFCGLFLSVPNRGIELSPELLGQISARHLTLGFDIYGPSANNDVA
jgi:hypothetical protein